MAGRAWHCNLRASPSQQVRTGPRQRVARPARNAVLASAASDSAASVHYMLSSGIADFYEILGVDDDAPTEEIKKAYRALAKECHPDILGDAKGHEICILLNEAYDVLSDPESRGRYDAQLEKALADEDAGYTGQPLSKWIPSIQPQKAKHVNPLESRAVFVDEVACIGCKNCVFYAPATFRMEPDYGRSRVYAQWLEPEDTIETAIESCPVSCIHWVQKADLPALEYVMQTRVKRVNVGVMMSGQGQVPDVFDITAQFERRRREIAEAQAKSKRYYSPSQEQARRRAAQDLAEQQMGFFSRFSDMFATVQDSVRSAVGNDAPGRVGGRKRSQHWYERDAARTGSSGGGGEPYSVPPERALVPISVYAKKPDV